MTINLENILKPVLWFFNLLRLLVVLLHVTFYSEEMKSLRSPHIIINLHDLEISSCSHKLKHFKVSLRSYFTPLYPDLYADFYLFHVT